MFSQHQGSRVTDRIPRLGTCNCDTGTERYCISTGGMAKSAVEGNTVNAVVSTRS